MIRSCYLIILVFAGVLTTNAQDRVYYKKNKTDEWKVTSVGADYLKGIDSKNPAVSYSTTNKNVLFLFNDKGNFLVIPKLFDNSRQEMYIANFFKSINNAYGKVDIIITTEFAMIGCAVDAESDKFVQYKLAGKVLQLPKNKIAVVIFKNGAHKLFTEADKAWKVLSAVQDKYNEVAFSPAKPAVPVQNGNATQAVLVQHDTARHSPDGRAWVKSDSISTQTQQTATAIKTGIKEDPRKDKNLDKETFLKLQEKAIQHVKELASYILLLSNKKTGPDEAGKVIDQAVSLFVNEDAQFEVSSLNRSAVQQYKVRIYLNRLNLLKYNKVKIEWYNVLYTSQLRKGADGNYYGVVAFEQRFTGISGDNKRYQDVTRKTVEIILKPYAKNRDGVASFEWDAFLGNIGISVTRPL